MIQAVGRAMRTAPGKDTGYIICPIVIPPQADPEEWLQTAAPQDGWQELGQILLALRAHDERIEDQLADLITLYIPPAQEVIATAVSVAPQGSRSIRHYYHVGAKDEAQKVAEQVVERNVRPGDAGLRPLNELQGRIREEPPVFDTTGAPGPAPLTAENVTATDIHTLLTTHQNADGSTETRVDRAPREKPGKHATLAPIDIRGSKKKARRMMNNGEGSRLQHTTKRKKSGAAERSNRNAQQMLLQTGLHENTRAIRMNLLTRSGLKGNKVERDLNILRDCVLEAGRHLREDGLQSALARHLQMDNLAEGKRNDSCNVAALLLMNAAMLHQRIAAGNWLTGISSLSAIKNDARVVQRVCREWERILRHDFQPVLEPALETVYAAESTGKTAGLEKALRHVAAAAQEIAATYADMGTDHAGPIFNEFMGNQASDGAFFTRPVAASMAARLTLDACGEADWTNPQVWRDHKTVDLACGSGTLLAAMLAEMKRRARQQGAGDHALADLQKLAVEGTLKGLDINPMSLQLAASQLTAGNRNIQYRRMGLHLMPYGPSSDTAAAGRVSTGTLELLAQKAIVERSNDFVPDDSIASQGVWQETDATLEDIVEAVKDARIVIMNPPFTNRSNVGEKFPRETQEQLRSRIDRMGALLVNNDSKLKNFVNKNSLGRLFDALADKCADAQRNVTTTISPTIALSNTSAVQARRVLAQRYHIHTVLTCHQPGKINLSQNTSINESIMVMRRHDMPPPPPPPRHASSIWTGCLWTTPGLPICTNVLRAASKGQSPTAGVKYRTGPPNASRPATGRRQSGVPLNWRKRHTPTPATPSFAPSGQPALRGVSPY